MPLARRLRYATTGSRFVGQSYDTEAPIIIAHHADGWWARLDSLGQRSPRSSMPEC
jgi:hypothetical protein